MLVKRHFIFNANTRIIGEEFIEIKVIVPVAIQVVIVTGWR